MSYKIESNIAFVIYNLSYNIIDDLIKYLLVIKLVICYLKKIIIWEIKKEYNFISYESNKKYKTINIIKYISCNYISNLYN